MKSLIWLLLRVRDELRLSIGRGEVVEPSSELHGNEAYAPRRENLLLT